MRHPDRRNVLYGVAGSGIFFTISAASPSARKATRSFAEFGAQGDGQNDDTAAINRAAQWSAAHRGKVVGRQGVEYRIVPSIQNSFLSPGGGTFSALVGITIPSAAEIDFNGASLKIDGEGIGLSNESSVRGRDCIIVKNVRVDIRSGGEYGLLFVGCVNSTFSNISVVNGRSVAVAFASLSDCFIDQISVEDCVGLGVVVGGNTAWRVSDCHVGRLTGRNIASAGTVHQPGNPFLFGAVNTKIDLLDARNCAGGIKFTSGCDRIKCDSVYFDNAAVNGQALATDNSGLKVQGDSAAACADNLTFNRVVVTNCSGAGLFLRYCSNVVIHSYRGINNGRQHVQPDINCVDGGSLYIDSAEIVNPGARSIQMSKASKKLEIVVMKLLDSGDHVSVFPEAMIADGGLTSIGSVTTNKLRAPVFRIGSNAGFQAKLHVGRFVSRP